jgi:hypothetical protein
VFVVVVDQFGVNPRAAVDLPRVGVDLTDQCRQPGVVTLAR